MSGCVRERERERERERNKLRFGQLLAFQKKVSLQSKVLFRRKTHDFEGPRWRRIISENVETNFVITLSLIWFEVAFLFLVLIL